MTFEHGLKLGTVIGQGHFGNVHEGRDDIHGIVAVKVLKQAAGEPDDEWHARRDSLLGEGQRLKRCEHKNVVRVFNLVRRVSDDLLHLVIEYCDGGSAEVSYQASPTPLLHVKKIALDTLAGLEAVHSEKMIHRDIKPGNIMRHGALWKLSDFGLVADESLYGYAAGAGYLAHLAPEFYEDDVTSRRTDVWAMGMTIYLMTSGHRWYEEAFDGVDIEESVKGGGFARRLKWLPHVPEAWRKLVRKAMHDDPSQRIQTALDFAQGVGQLPADQWKCEVTPALVTWERKDGPRVLRVEWHRHSARRHEWTAIREGGGKRTITIGSSQGVVSSSTAVRQLEQMFAKHSS